MDPKQIWSMIQTVTGGAVLAVLVWAFVVGKIVSGKAYEAKCAELEEYKQKLFGKLDSTPK